MFAGETVRAKFWVTRAMIGEVVDLFGRDVTFSQEDEKGAVATVVANELSVEQFAKIYAPDVVVLSPKKTADRLAECSRKTLENYAVGEPAQKPSPSRAREDPRREALTERWQDTVRQLQEDGTLHMPDAKSLFAETWRYWTDPADGGIDRADLPMLGAMYTVAGQNEYPDGVKPWEFDAYLKLVKALLSALEDPLAQNGGSGNFYEGYLTVEEWVHCEKAVGIEAFDSYFDELADLYYADGYADSYDKDGTQS